MSTPERIQLSRKKGWRKPENTVVVARPSKWGNPFKVGTPFGRKGEPPTGKASPELVVTLYRAHIGIRINEIRAELAGKNLACWCPLTDADGNRVPCHADVLLELANRESGGSE